MRTLTLLALVACSGAQKTPTPAPAPAPTSDNDAALDALGKDVASAMKPEADACEDFYAFACGGWIESTELPADRPIVTRSFTSIHESNQEVIRALLDGAVDNPGDDPVLKKLGAFYGSCMDTDAIEARGLAPVQPWLDEIDGVESAADALALAGSLQDFGPNPFFGIGVWADDKQPDMNILVVAQDGLGLPDKAYYAPTDEKGEKLLADYEKHVARMFVLFGAQEGPAAEMAADVVAFETELAKTHIERIAMRDADARYNKMTFAELEALAPKLDLKGYFGGAGITPPAHVNAMVPSNMEGLSALVDDTDVETLRHYLRWHTMHWAAPYLTEAVDKENFAFFATALSGTTEQSPRWKRCVERTNDAMGDWVGKAYVDLKFAGNSKALAEEMVEGIFDAFEGNLPGVAWMDDATREKAVQKSNAFVAKLGYPDQFKDYSDVEVDPAKHFEALIAGNRHGTDEMEAKIGQPVDKGEWHMTPQIVNAYYNPPANEIVFPAGIMQAPFFDKDFPRAMNYGALGMVIGHEITHGFDDEGRKYAPSGELKEWWAPEVTEKFEEAAQCVVDQYDGFKVGDLNVKGELTLGENIADLGGLKVAHLAYMEWAAKNGEQPKVAGLTDEQQVFVAFAQGWCTVATPEVEALRVNTDPHSPPRYRVNGAVMNYPAFAEAFGCEKGDPMAPEDVCQVW